MYRQSTVTIEVTRTCYLNHEQFRIRLAEELLSAGTTPTPLPPTSRLTERHFSSKISLNSNGKQPQYDCHVCSDRKKEKRKTTTYCSNKCNVPLCLF